MSRTCHVLLIASLFSAAFLACGSDDSEKDTQPEEPMAPTREALCEKLNILERETGCSETEFENCAITDDCLEQGDALLECLLVNREGFYCEEDGNDLNVESQLKEDDGPATCKAQNEALKTCLPTDEEE
ncbi:MAG: hypothetical protein ACPGQS_10850 [Bradymonadia bacterium]